MSKKRMIALDADSLIFTATEGKSNTGKYFKQENEGDALVEKAYNTPLKTFKTKFKRLVKEIEKEVNTATSGKVKGIKIFLSDPDTNFRYRLYPEYKNKRDGSKRSPDFYRLRKWALKKYGYVKDCEADDIVAYYVREKKYIGASLDKDLLSGVAGTWFNVYWNKRIDDPVVNVVSDEDARVFTLLQTLAGDNVDSIPGIPRVGLKTALNLLQSNGYDWNGVVAAYQNAKLTKEDALLNRRLVGMDQYNGKKIVLWTP